MLRLNILNRHGIEYSYIVLLDDYWDFRGETKEQFIKWVDTKHWNNVKKTTAKYRVGFALDIHCPNSFYEFTKGEQNV